jgi:hypothetical protein
MVSIGAICCLISACGSTNLSRFATPVKCALCDELYFIDYSPAEAASIEGYERKAREVAQIKINSDHPQRPGIELLSHSTYIPIERI